MSVLRQEIRAEGDPPSARTDAHWRATVSNFSGAQSCRWLIHLGTSVNTVRRRSLNTVPRQCTRRARISVSCRGWISLTEFMRSGELVVNIEQSVQLRLMFTSILGIRNYKCPKCSKCLSSPSALYTHKKTHGEKVFQCEFCPKTFTLKNYLKLHVKQVHEQNERKHICHFCNKSFAYAGSLQVMTSYVDMRPITITCRSTCAPIPASDPTCVNIVRRRSLARETFKATRGLTPANGPTRASTVGGRSFK